MAHLICMRSYSLVEFECINIKIWLQIFGFVRNARTKIDMLINRMTVTKFRRVLIPGNIWKRETIDDLRISCRGKVCCKYIFYGPQERMAVHFIKFVAKSGICWWHLDTILPRIILEVSFRLYLQEARGWVGQRNGAMRTVAIKSRVGVHL